MLKNSVLVPNIGVDTAENGPSKVDRSRRQLGQLPWSDAAPPIATRMLLSLEAHVLLANESNLETQGSVPCADHRMHTSD